MNTLIDEAAEGKLKSQIRELREVVGRQERRPPVREKLADVLELIDQARADFQPDIDESSELCGRLSGAEELSEDAALIIGDDVDELDGTHRIQPVSEMECKHSKLRKASSLAR